MLHQSFELPLDLRINYHESRALIRPETWHGKPRKPGVFSLGCESDRLFIFFALIESCEVGKSLFWVFLVLEILYLFVVQLHTAHDVVQSLEVALSVQ